MDVASGAVVKQIDLGCDVQQLRFSSDGRRLITDCGVFVIGRPRHEPNEPEASAPAHLSVDSNWITYADHDILWLSHDRRRRSHFTFYGNTFACCGYDGTIAQVEIDPSEMALATSRAPRLSPHRLTWYVPERTLLDRLFRRMNIGGFNTQRAGSN
jgi:hypothetical protein